MSKYFTNLRDLLLLGQTLSVRFFFSLFSIFLAVDTMLDPTPEAPVRYLSSLTPSWATEKYFWGYLLLFHACALLKGLSGKYGMIPLIFEGVLGWALWTVIAMTNIFNEAHPGISFAGFLVATWLLIRYPTHWKASRE